jgi:hypothetical protein
MDNTYIYNVEGDNRLSPGLQPLTTGSMLKILFFPVRFRYCIYYTGNYFIVITKQNIQNFKHLLSSFGNKQLSTFERLTTLDAYLI